MTPGTTYCPRVREWVSRLHGSLVVKTVGSAHGLNPVVLMVIIIMDRQ